jgi:hypothetical protein
MGCWNPFCGVSELAEAVVDAVSGLSGDVVDAIEQAYDKSGDLLGAAGDLLVDALSDVGKGFVDIGDALGEGIQYIGDATIVDGLIVSARLLNAAGDLVGWVIDGIIWMVDVVEDVAEVAAQALATAGQFAFDAITLNENIFNHLAGNLEIFAGDFLRLYESTVKGAFAQLENLYEMTLGQAFGDLARLADTIPIIGEALGDTIRAVNDSLGFGLQFAESLAAMPTLIACQYTDWLQEDPELDGLIAQVLDPDISTAAGRRVRRLPPVSQTTKYVVFSDLHRFVPGDTDFFTRNGTPRIFRSLLHHFSVDGYTLIENGDVEDLWRRDSGNPSIDNSLGAGTHTTNRTLLRSILDANRIIYDQIEKEYASHGRYARTAGNHDMPLLESYMERVLQDEALPSSEVDEFLLIEAQGGAGVTHLITHGHQSDNFNRPGCEWFGESATRLVSRFFQVPILGEFMAGLSSEEPDVDEQFTQGRENVLSANEYLSLYATLDEPALYDAYEELVGQMPLPWILLGHSHKPKYAPGVRERQTECSDGSEQAPPAWGPQPDLDVGGYLNTGTAGMIKDIVWFATIQEDDAGQVTTLLNSARLDPAGTHVLMRPYDSIAACGVLSSIKIKPQKAQWLDPDSAAETIIPAV